MKKLNITMEIELEACPFCGNTRDFTLSQNVDKDGVKGGRDEKVLASNSQMIALLLPMLLTIF